MHQHFPCARGSESEKMFFRKDNLMQHLRITRHVGKSHLKRMKGLISSWENEPTLPPGSPFLICSICGNTSRDWKSRVNHIATHCSQQRAKSSRDIPGNLIGQPPSMPVKSQRSKLPFREKGPMFILGGSSADEDESCGDDTSLRSDLTRRDPSAKAHYLTCSAAKA